jgi:tRNA A-37 threonylcarbamoyl transferase component Bud32
LEHDAPAGSGFQSAVEQEAEVLARQNTESFIGRRIGAYRVTGLIGEGGMGAIYRAVRDDDQYRKEVAVKLVRHGFETPALVARFREERQILASLEHPYVARLLDGGVTSNNVPYLVMELVDGVPITQYAARHALSVEARLRLLQKVSEAVEYAHSRLVVHRDLKPGNILITADGTPKLLDFGIAKLLTDSAQQRTESSRTQHLLTPDYASPEQVRGMPATVATDIKQGIRSELIQSGQASVWNGMPVKRDVARTVMTGGEAPGEILVTSDWVDDIPGFAESRRTLESGEDRHVQELEAEIQTLVFAHPERFADGLKVRKNAAGRSAFHVHSLSEMRLAADAPMLKAIDPEHKNKAIMSVETEVMNIKAVDMGPATFLVPRGFEQVEFQVLLTEKYVRRHF